MWRIGIDVGGTFTDLFAWNDTTGRRVTSKVLTTKQDRALGVLNAIDAANIPFGEVSHLMHGTTTATNSLIERSFPDAAMVTTAGFRDVIETGRQHREHLYSPYQRKPVPVIRRRYRYTVAERMSADGRVITSLDPAQANAVAERIAQTPMRSIAVAFLNSYSNDAHERQMREILLEHMPDAQVALSTDTRPLFREHGRFTTTAIRAALMPVMADYFGRLHSALQERGFRGVLLILKSNGGVMGVDLARRRPEELIESGPAGGVAYGTYLTEQTGFPNIIHTDMGGTSFDASIVENGQGLLTRSYELEWDVPVIVPMLDIHSVGAGGGSIGWIDGGGSLRVGPRSAGSEPGPACYGRGGTEPTITDANLLLGRLNPTLGGKFTLDKQAAEAAMARLASKTGLSVLETAEGMIRISCESMAQAVKKVLTARGRDPRDFVYASFGGAGAMHACQVADAMSIPKVVVPIYAGVASAFGATAMSIRHDVERFFYAPLAKVDLAKLNTILGELEAEGLALLARDGVAASDISITRTAQMRYVGQTFEVESSVPAGDIGAAELAQIEAGFHESHRREYGVSSSEFEPAIVSVTVTVIGATRRPPNEPTSGPRNATSAKGSRPMYFDGQWLDVPIWEGEALGSEQRVDGPAAIDYAHTCVVMPPRTSAVVDRYDNLLIELNRSHS